ncbi:hypothetical protein F4777DRAFT_576354 [Nemania sp. FL0916]|nr:hypothetical protein F4777DRAFT_576354 [Nemania sp. FL0916]
MDGVSAAASVIAIVSAALQSAKATYRLIDGLVEAPKVVARSKAALLETQKTLSALQQMLIRASDSPSPVGAVLQMLKLDETLKATQIFCDQFHDTIAGFTSHSTTGRFSKRDRITVTIRGSKINKFNRELGGCQGTISAVMEAINLIITAQTADDVQQIMGRFRAQDQTLITLDNNLDQRAAISSELDGDQVSTALHGACQEALPNTEANRTPQTFGEMSTTKDSKAMQGIVGKANHGIEQSFKNMMTSNKSRGFQGQLDAASFAVMFGK